ncbi:hypothetical protein G5I_09807 [Acromyrmex echinatior]|uniref:RCC1 and BTB domain-containing protein 1 n=1 Tax=Acromyrmex echinatior TaxID=103372 RepID=F4WV17_ACREC|nr:hypothetical protein G5I_09807 [Acromyrmex echinatior]
MSVNVCSSKQEEESRRLQEMRGSVNNQTREVQNAQGIKKIRCSGKRSNFLLTPMVLILKKIILVLRFWFLKMESLMIEGTDRSVNFCELYSITLNLIPFSPKITVKVATGFDHILVLTTEGKVYGWGVNTHGQLNFNRENLPETTQIKSPSKIFIPNVNNVSDIAAMKYISAFKSSYDGRIYIQGCLHNLKIKRLAICEYTNIFDRYNSSFHSVEKNRIYTEEDKNILDDLSWVYSDYINQMIELLILADKFCVTNLEKECIKYLKIHMKPSTVSYIKEMAIKYNKAVAELEQYCDAYELREAYDPTQIIL